MHTAHTPEWPELLRPWELPLAKPGLPAETLVQSASSNRNICGPSHGAAHCSSSAHSGWFTSPSRPVRSRCQGRRGQGWGKGRDGE